MAQVLPAERDLRRVKKQKKDLDKLEAVVNLLQEEQPLPPAAGRTRYGESGLDIGTAISNRIGCSFTGWRVKC